MWKAPPVSEAIDQTLAMGGGHTADSGAAPTPPLPHVWSQRAECGKASLILPPPPHRLGGRPRRAHGSPSVFRLARTGRCLTRSPPATAPAGETGGGEARTERRGLAVHTVTLSDTLSSVAVRHGMSKGEVMRLNRMSSEWLFAGSKLYVRDASDLGAYREALAAAGGVQSQPPSPPEPPTLAGLRGRRRGSGQPSEFVAEDAFSVRAM